MSLITKGMNTPLLVIGGLAGSGVAPGPAWAGWRKVLTTDQYGHIVGQPTAITDLVVADSYDVLLSGPFNPATTIQSATLYVDTSPGDANVFTEACVIVADGSSGLFAVAGHMTGAHTALLTLPRYLWSLVIVDSGGNRWTPIDGEALRPRTSAAV